MLLYVHRPDEDDHLLRVPDGSGPRTIDCGLPSIPSEKYRRDYYVRDNAAPRGAAPTAAPRQQTNMFADIHNQTSEKVQYFR